MTLWGDHGGVAYGLDVSLKHGPTLGQLNGAMEQKPCVDELFDEQGHFPWRCEITTGHPRLNYFR